MRHKIIKLNEIVVLLNAVDSGNVSTVNTTNRLLHPNCLERNFSNPFLLKKT